MVAEWTPDPVELAAVHRFRTPQGGRGTTYADLSLRIRSGIDPDTVFDELLARGHVRLHDSDADALAVIAVETADRYLAGTSHSVSLGTNEEVEQVNQLVRERLVHAGLVDDTRTVHGSDGLPIGVGDRVTTRTNNSKLGIANRMTWTVTHIAQDRSLTLAGDHRGDGTQHQVTVEADYVRDSVHLAYASTAHGVQGQTSDHGRLRLTDSTDAAALYVGMTRGAHSNQIHIVADNPTQAREQWTAAANRDRADHGLHHATTAASREADNYTIDRTVGPVRSDRTDAPTDREDFADRLARIKSTRSLRDGVTGRRPERPLETTVASSRRVEREAELLHEDQRQHRHAGPRV